MLSRLASYLLGGAGPEDEVETGPGLPAAPAIDDAASHTLQTDESPASQEQRQQQLRLRQTEVEGDDWILIDRNVEGCTGMEESWYVTPPACFTRPGPVHVETSPLENLLIEHPSMSVYRDAVSSALLETSAGSSASTTNRSAEEMLLQETDSSGYGVLTWTTGKPPAGPGSSSRQQADCWSGHPAKPRQPPSLRRQVEEDEEEQEKELLEDKQEEAAATGLVLATKAGCSPSRRMQVSKPKCPASSRLVQISKPECPPSRLSKPVQSREPEKRRMSGAGPQSQLYHHHHHHHHHQSSSGKLTRRQHLVGHVLRPRDGNVPANAGALAVQQPSKEQRPGSGAGLDNQENSRQRHRQQQQQMAEQQRHRRPSHGVRELRAGPLEEELRVAQIRSAQQVLQKRTSQASKRNRLERANKAREVASGKGRNPRRQDRMRSNNSYVNNNRKC